MFLSMKFIIFINIKTQKINTIFLLKTVDPAILSW